MNEIIIKAENLGKKYIIGQQVQNGGYVALRDVWMQNARSLWFKSRDILKGKINIKGETPEDFWALKDVSFELHRGEAVGIIGRNGAGKSTLLKVLSKITEPSAGRVTIKGRVASLLEIGTGFHPELTGRENVYLNGAILGMTRNEIRRKFDEIVAFAEVEKFLDTPVKRYSSGMYVRLAFAVAAHLEPEILVVDEVLAVGDAEFQKKSMGKMQTVANEGRAVLFVSHNMGAIQSMCQRAIWLDGGRVMSDGISRNVVQQYMQSANTGSVLYTPEPKDGYTDLIIEKIILRNSQGEGTTTVFSGEELRVEVYYKALKRLPKPCFWIAVRSRFGSLFGANMLFDAARPDYIEGRGMIACIFSDTRLLPQTYTIRLGVRHQNGINNYIRNAEVSFTVFGTARDLGMAGETAHNYFEDFYSLLVPYAWILPDGRTVPVNGFHSNTDSSVASDLKSQGLDCESTE